MTSKHLRFPISDWRLLFCVLCAFALSFSAQAQLKITASITVTNKTTNGMTFTWNGDTRTFTNNVVNAATQVGTNADTTGCGSKTNLLTQIRATPFTQTRVVDLGSNSFSLVGNADLPVSFSMSSGLGTVSYSTQLVTDLVLAQLPVSGLPTAAARTTVASGIAGALNQVENTNAISQISTAASELMGTTNTQTISGIKKLTNAAGQFWGIISNSPAISGTVILLAGGVFTSPALGSPTTTNLVNYGNAISSKGSAALSEQFGVGASATSGNSLAVGAGSSSSGVNSIAVGPFAAANNDNSMAVGNSALADGVYGTAVGNGARAGSADATTALGYTASATGTNSTAIGTGATASHNDSTAIGANAVTTATNQVVLGSSGANVVVPNTLTVGGNVLFSGNVAFTGPQTNATYKGTNNFAAESDIAFVRKSLSSLANGNNAAIPVGTNVFVEVSGPSGAFTINGIAGGRDGKLLILENATGFTMTIANQSGTDPTAANRILTGLSGDYANTNNPGCVTLIYNANVSRWILVSHN